jgi:Asp-tRNA(Asn)/Glu-tRNA(Gln) amidotransferase A subunit family amidase
MEDREYRRFDAVGLAELIGRGEISAGEALEAAIARAQAVNPKVNAIVHEQFDRARKEVEQGLADGPLKGVPFLLKDLAFFQEGEPATLGSRLFADYVADHDSVYTARCRQAGLVIMGRSNSPEFGLNASTEPVLHGPCRNPWNLEYSAGGSSGGAAAAVAAGILPLAHATDGGGSIRIPAAQCGLFGLKPTRGRMTMAPDAGEGWGGLSIGHVVSRSVRDSALMLDCTAGAAPGDPYSVPSPPRPFAEEVDRAPGQLRVALMRQDHRGEKLHPDCVDAVNGTAALLQSLGHTVEEAAPPIDLRDLRRRNTMLSSANIARNLGLRWQALGREPSADDVEAGSWASYRRGLKVTGVQYADAVAEIHAAGRRFAAFMEAFDIVLSTTVPAPPPQLGWLDMDGDVAAFSERAESYISITPVHNATGTPAMSVPLCWNEEGLPIGLHFAARYGEEATLLRLAGQLERAQPWFERVPDL